MKDLIQLAQDVGFKTRIHGLSYACGTEDCNCEWREEQDPTLLDYLFMCELQQWLREQHKMELEIALGFEHLVDAVKNSYGLTIFHETFDFIGQFESYEKALQKGLLKLLPLIP